MNVLLLLAHSIAEHDDARMLRDMGYDVFSIGAYTDPLRPGDDKRPALPQLIHHAELEALVPDQMKAKEHLPAELIDWADVIIAHHYVDRWLAGQWGRIRGKRVIWRTCGQSDFRLEDLMAPLRRDGLEVVRYSPAEQRYFQPSGHWAGQDALIRFGKYVDDYGPWNGLVGGIANVTQDMAGRGEWCGLGYYLAATRGLRARPAGPSSEKLPGGIGTLTYDQMLAYLASSGAYLYTGTMPASYTLGLMEALLSGVPVVSIGARSWMGPDELFEAHELVGDHAYNDPMGAATDLQLLLREPEYAADVSLTQRTRARAMFHVEHIGAQWRKLLGDPSTPAHLEQYLADPAIVLS